MTSFNYKDTTLPLLFVHTGGTPGARTSTDRLSRCLSDFPWTTKILRILSEIARMGRDRLKEGNLRLVGKLMSKNHNLLRLLDQTSEKTDRLVSILEDAGVYGAKAIGFEDEGCVVALFPRQSKDNIISCVKKPAKVVLDDFSLAVPGVRIERNINSS